MYQTKRQLKRENEELKAHIKKLRDKLQACNNLQSDDLHQCKDFYCIGCEHAIVTDHLLPIVLLGCKIGAKCPRFEPNELYKNFHYDRSKEA